MPMTKFERSNGRIVQVIVTRAVKVVEYDKECVPGIFRVEFTDFTKPHEQGYTGKFGFAHVDEFVPTV